MSAKFKAWTVSVAVHLIVLTVFGFVKLSGDKPQTKPEAASVVRLQRVRKLVNADNVIPKPKIKKNIEKKPVQKSFLKNDVIFNTAKVDVLNPPDLTEAYYQVKPHFYSDEDFFSKTEFFGSSTDHRKICYLVDCSGSMKGIFEQVREQLYRSIKSLQQDQYFCVIFFGDDRLFEFGRGKVFRATPQRKADACEFAGTIQPAGATNAFAALERAVHIYQHSDVKPSVFYFLTDGFELSDKNEHKFAQKVINLLNRLAPETKINTIGFWPQSSDRKMLETIAERTGGEFIFICDSNY